MSERQTDVEIGEVNTRIEVTDRAPDVSREVPKLAEMVLQRLRQERHEEAMRSEDGKIRDRSWVSDVKPD